MSLPKWATQPSTKKPAPVKAVRRSGVAMGPPMSRQQVMTKAQFRRFMSGVPTKSAMVFARSPTW